MELGHLNPIIYGLACMFIKNLQLKGGMLEGPPQIDIRLGIVCIFSLKSLATSLRSGHYYYFFSIVEM